MQKNEDLTENIIEGVKPEKENFYSHYRYFSSVGDMRNRDGNIVFLEGDTRMVDTF